VARRILALALVPYVLWLVFAYEYHFLDGVNLLFHEAGHVFFGLFGPTLHFLGGTLAQLFFPLAAGLHFLTRRELFETAVCTVWLAESGMYAAEYIADAQAQVLPLVGGHTHDWGWLLSRWGLLARCETIGAGVHGLSSLLALAAVASACGLAFRRAPGA
jgi:hypothetical protein